MALKYYHHNGVGLRIRDDQRERWDKIITQECQRHYEAARFSLALQTYVFDIGANIGAYSLWALRNNPDAHVIAIEADAQNAEVCALNLAGLAHVYVGACAYTGAEFVIDRRVDCGGYSRLMSPDTQVEHPLAYREPWQGQRYTIEELLAEHDWPRIDVLKIDAERAEYDILVNCDDATLQNTRYIVGEYHDGIARYNVELKPRLDEWFAPLHITQADDWGTFVLKNRSVK